MKPDRSNPKGGASSRPAGSALRGTKLPSVYEPGKHEPDIYALWEKSVAFKPKGKGRDGYFSLVAPPPNANAGLHIGYGLTMAIEDIMVRFNRSQGREALFVPGADHAGFETWVVYEKKLAQEGKSRFDFTRDELYKQVWDFVAQNRSTFEKQFRRLGASVDWDRFTFTLDEKVVRQAYATFKKMWDEDLIYRGERLVNFCTFHGTSFADVEVNFREVNGHLWYIRYPLTDGSGEVTIATTRPETMLGDTAVAVHAADSRYSKFIGKTVKLPLTSREIPIIADEMVDLDFGTGAVKITPAHDYNDYEVALRHDLPLVKVIDHEGKMTAEVPEAYRGLAVEEARVKVVEDLKGQGFLAKAEGYRHSVGHCYKCGTVIQPLLREQWFVATKTLAAKAVKALKGNQIEFYPSSKKDQLVKYYGGLRDWNISRQIAWGIPIPAFQNIDEPDDWIFDERVDRELIKKDGKTYRRDPDVFDTWFSSSSWPYVTLNYPNGEDFKKFYPLSVMETGGEILYPWVSRMIMLGLYETGRVPFTKVYIHGYVMAEDGSKMSKSLGNVIDLTEVIDQYGSDALRMGIVAGRAAGINRGYDHRKVEEARNFANKLWNVARYTDSLAGQGGKKAPRPESAADHWILNKLSISAEAIRKDLEEFRFAEAYETLYHFVWDDFADWYIEASKARPNLSVLASVLRSTLVIAHPFAPFVTEAIWQNLQPGAEGLLAEQLWPKAAASDARQAKAFEKIRQIVVEIRHISNVLNVKGPVVSYRGSRVMSEHKDLVAWLGKLEKVQQPKDGPKGLALTSAKGVWLNIKRPKAVAYTAKLREQKKQAQAALKLLAGRLDNKNYVEKAPKDLITQTRSQLEEQVALLEKIEAEIKKFDSFSA